MVIKVSEEVMTRTIILASRRRRFDSGRGLFFVCVVGGALIFVNSSGIYLNHYFKMNL